MKKIVFLLTFGGLLLACACKKENPTTNKYSLDAAWKVQALNDADVTKYSATCNIATAAKKANGTSGCNTFGADINLFDENQQLLELDAIVQTKIGCQNDLGIFEMNYFNTLNAVTHYTFVNANTLILKTYNGANITLKK